MGDSKAARCVEEDVQIPLQCVIPPEQDLMCDDSVMQGISEHTLVNTQRLDDTGRLAGSFVGSNVFNLSKRNLTEAEISVLLKGLDFCPVPIDFDKEQLKNAFADFARKLRSKWYFKDDVSDGFSEIPSFRVKSGWQAPEESWGPYIEVFLSELLDDISKIEDQGSYHPSLSKDEREALKTLSSDTSIVIKSGDKGSAVVVWDRYDYFA